MVVSAYKFSRCNTEKERCKLGVPNLFDVFMSMETIFRLCR